MSKFIGTATMRDITALLLIPALAFAFFGVVLSASAYGHDTGTTATTTVTSHPFSSSGTFTVTSTSTSQVTGTISATETVGTTTHSGTGTWTIWPTWPSATGSPSFISGMFSATGTAQGTTTPMYALGTYTVTSGMPTGTSATATPITGTFQATTSHSLIATSSSMGTATPVLPYANITGTFSIVPTYTATGTGTSTGTSTFPWISGGSITATGTATVYGLVATTSPTTTPTTSTTTVTTTATTTPFLDFHYALNDGGLTFETDLSPSFEVPPVGTTTGTSSVVVGGSAGIWFDSTDVNYWLFVESEDQKITGAHFHCGLPNQNGPIVVSLYTNAQGVSGIDGELARGDITDSSIASTGAQCASTIGYAINSENDFLKAMREGKIYANVHSIDYPAGVSRGQLQQVTNYVSEDEFNRLQND